MSPEYSRWQEVPKDIKQILAEELKKLSLSTAYVVNEGVAWHDVNGNLCIKNLDELTSGQRADARKKDSPWHVLLPLKNSSRDKPQHAPHLSDVTRRWRNEKAR